MQACYGLTLTLNVSLPAAPAGGNNFSPIGTLVKEHNIVVNSQYEVLAKGRDVSRDGMADLVTAFISDKVTWPGCMSLF